MEDCSFCNKTVKQDFCVKCSTKNCKQYYHTKCIFINNDQVTKVKDENMSFYYWIFHCEEHTSINYLIFLEKENKQKDEISLTKTYGKNINTDIAFSQIK
jgi:hypothetical protein